MSDLLSRRLALLAETEHLPLLNQCLHGVERECLRVDATGHLAMTPHPKALGSALTHSKITTDYSEALLEFITGTHTHPDSMLEELSSIQRFTCAQLDQEWVWSASMPCVLPEEKDIPIAQYGSSNIGRLKHVYRQGLAVRYGKTMQCIAGIHYNFSLAPELWALLQRKEEEGGSVQDFQSARYIALIRNFRRYSWILMYLFGASPALDRGFLTGHDHQLEVLDDETLYLPYATSLRMSDLGYQNNAQAGLTPCYDNLSSYTQNLCKAVSTPYPPYEALGCKRDGEWIQLNTNVLQIENEYYSSIRLKRVTVSGERPVQALRARGIQYVEVRCLDIDPFLPLGLDSHTAHFVTTFLLYCALQESPKLVQDGCQACSHNFSTVVKEGRKPGLTLRRDGTDISLQAWALEMLEDMQPVAALLDKAQASGQHLEALKQQMAKVMNPALTPSARVLQHLQSQQQSFQAFALAQSHIHAEALAQVALSPEQQLGFEEQAKLSLAEQAAVEASDTLPFDDFVQAYQNSLSG